MGDKEFISSVTAYYTALRLPSRFPLWDHVVRVLQSNYEQERQDLVDAVRDAQAKDATTREVVFVVPSVHMDSLHYKCRCAGMRPLGKPASNGVLEAQWFRARK